MEDDDDPSSDFEPLFIREENGDPETNWSTLDFTRTHMSQPSSMGPYLLEMDDLLKRCEELTDIPLESDPEQMLGERETSPYFSTSHTGNTMGMADECAEHQFHEDMPITSSGNKLSSTMVQYEGQLMGMLAMLESCMDEAPVDLQMNQEYVHVNKVKDMTSERQSVGHRDPSRNRSESEVHDQEFKYSKPSMTVGCTSRVDDVNVTDSPTESLEMEMSFGVDGFQTLASQMEKCIEELQRLERKRKDLLGEVLQLRRQEAKEEEEEEATASDSNISNRVNELMAVLRKEEEDRREERKREVQLLRSEVAEEERRVWKAEMEKQELRDEMRKLKRQLFTKAKESAHIQAALNKRRHETDLQKREEEKLQTLFQQMTEEGSQLKSQHQQYLRDLRAEICVCTASRTCNTTQEELSRRNSCGDIQQYLQDSLRALENRYEPVLLGLQKRKETTTRASLKAKEQTRELKAQLGPLREEMQAQVLQRARLEEKLKLVHVQRREDAEHYEESIRCLERSSRELKMELTVQRRKNKEAADLRDCLSKQILLYRSAAGDHQKSENQKEA
ncbi:trichohyalin [Hippocampus comes]|uniref:Trichohyalin-like n=1 Tax=Hippocampus comes TaxID=109280 RepID=A0A3Q2XXB5_HIPCM|nr:PREDICTED: trichohyalin-like [Hippocampus comes]XP_019731827.1 PREDICTED: trichohyalin-like [Hippocampus comes]